MALNISISNDGIAQTVTATKSLVRSESNMPLRILEQITINGKLLSLNGLSGSSKIQGQIDAFDAKKTGFESSVSVGNLTFSQVKIINVSFLGSNSRDTIEKDFSVTFEKYTAVDQSPLTQYGLNTQDLLNIKDLQTSSNMESNLEGKVLNQTFSITYEGHAKNATENAAATIAKNFFTASKSKLAANISPDRISLSSTSNTAGKTFSFTETQIEFRTPVGGNKKGVFISKNYNIQNNGAVIATGSVSIRASNTTDDRFDIQGLKTSADAEISTLESSINSDMMVYLGLGNNKLSSGIKTTLSKLDQQVSINETAGTVNISMTFTNALEYFGQERLRKEKYIIEEEIKGEDARRLTHRGSYQTLYEPPDKTFQKSNKKIKPAWDKFEADYNQILSTAGKRNPSQNFAPKGATHPTVITSASINVNLTEGIVDFSIVAESRRAFKIIEESQDIFSFEGGKMEGTPIHLANFFIVLGGTTPGEELIQESAQSKCVPHIIQFQGATKETKGLKNIVDKIKSLYEKEKNDFTESINITMNIAKKTFGGSITTFKCGEHRQRDDVAYQAKAPKAIQLS